MIENPFAFKEKVNSKNVQYNKGKNLEKLLQMKKHADALDLGVIFPSFN